MITEAIKNILANAGLEIRRNNSLRKNALRAFNIPKEEWSSRENGFYLNLLDITLQDESSLLLEGYSHARKIAVDGRGKFFFDDQNRLRLTINGASFFINFTDELYVIHEVFVAGDYNFNTIENLVVVDVGSNIGATSLFFSRRPNVVKIYAYELFGPTFQTGLKNLTLNDASKIESLNFGLGKMDEQISIEYSPNSKARMGIHGLPPNEKFDDVRMEQVTIRDAAEEFVRIAGVHPSIRKLCKMDCEGSEFDILNRLFECHAIRLMDVYMIEWHDLDPAVLVDTFLANGFEVIKGVSGNPGTGLIYAFRK